ncbi:MAG: hypothetical protein NVS3B5_03810 [Sphingomicrobium sp.]
MPMKLTTRTVEKPWGRLDLPASFSASCGRKVGEIWFESLAGSYMPLLIKYIFTSERLSIQVHPNDAQAISFGLPSGKQECWYILHCEPGATIGVGLTRTISEQEMRAAIADGGVERLLDWKPVKPGDFFVIPAGTIHAIGAGITLVEVQQNADVTYRLYDYGRPREVHLEQGLAVARLSTYDLSPLHVAMGQTRALLASRSMPFQLEMVSWHPGDCVQSKPAALSWFVPLQGKGCIDGQQFHPNECWLCDEITTIAGGEAGTALLAYFHEAVDA